MVDLGPLLTCPDSFLGRAAAIAVTGLKAGLEHALKLAPPDDPGRAAYQQVLESLKEPTEGNSLANTGWATSPGPGPEGASTPPTGGRSLGQVFQAFCEDPAVRQEVGSVNPADAKSDPDRWARLNALLLRTSPGLTEIWRERARRVVAGQIDPTEMVSLPGDPEEVFPGIAGAPGLRLSPDALFESRFGAPVAPDRALKPLAKVAAIALWAIDHDPYLCNALRVVNRFGVNLLRTASAQKAQVEQQLVNRFKRWNEAEASGDVLQMARAWIDLDEALNSLLHNPVAHEGSWWRVQQKRARDTVLELRDRVIQAGHGIHLIVPSGRYADVQAYTNPQDDKSFDGPVPPGDVVVCLKVYMKLDDNPYQGRVLYRPR